MKDTPPFFLLLLAVAIIPMAWLRADENLVPNPNFSDPVNPLRTWRLYFPWEDEWYAKNGDYVKASNQQGRTCALMDFPKKIAGVQGGKIESAFMPVVPGATYRVQVDCLDMGFNLTCLAEVWTDDPTPTVKPDKWRVPAEADHPALLTCYRAQLPIKGLKKMQWSTLSREFTVPKTVLVMNKPVAPKFATIKVFGLGGKEGKAAVTNFQLVRIR